MGGCAQPTPQGGTEWSTQNEVERPIYSRVTFEIRIATGF